jgi:Fe2+ transport system protein FeoA
MKMKPDFKFAEDTPGGEPGPEPPAEPLAGLPQGACGRILSVGVPALDLERLEVMGLCEGRFVQVIKQGNPMIVRVLGTRIGLAAELARAVHVRRDQAESGADEAGRGTGRTCTER